MRKKYLQHLNVPLSELNFKQQLYFKRIFLPMSRWILRHASGAPFNNMKIVLQKWRTVRHNRIFRLENCCHASHNLLVTCGVCIMFR